MCLSRLYSLMLCPGHRHWLGSGAAGAQLRSGRFAAAPLPLHRLRKHVRKHVCKQVYENVYELI